MSALYIVATPIGNLSDITLRALEILKTVHCIAAEDTRHSQKLLAHYDIHTPCFSLHEHNEAERVEKILTLLSTKKSIALISDAGTPLISDPGFRVVRAVQEAGYKVVPIPGACAAIAALSASGLATDRFAFEGFLPAKNNAREAALQQLKNETATLIFYESVHRVIDTLTAMKKIFGGSRKICIARELTKSFETITLGNIDQLELPPKKGEFVIVVQGAASAPEETTDVRAMLTILMHELPLKQAVKLTCELTGAPANATYQLALSIKH